MENLTALNAFAAVQIDPAAASVDEDGGIAANDGSWCASYEFCPDEGMFSFVASMIEMAQENGAAIEEKAIGNEICQVAVLHEDEGDTAYYAAVKGLPGLYGFLFIVEAQPGASLADFEAILATLTIDESAIPDAPESFGAEPSVPVLENDWATVQFDTDAASLRYHTVEANDGSWSVEFGLPMTDYGAETSRNDYKLITLGYGDQTDIVTGEKTLGAFSYRTIRYTQNGKACAYYDCTFDAPLNVTARLWDGSEEAQQVYGVYIHCKANDSAVLDELETIIASLVITGT
ncbi:MAG: hypothetical protein IJL52_03670 [Clostridia bacterium]|nr:hypothetical protein [Clostridia bacterium]